MDLGTRMYFSCWDCCAGSQVDANGVPIEMKRQDAIRRRLAKLAQQGGIRPELQAAPQSQPRHELHSEMAGQSCSPSQQAVQSNGPLQGSSQLHGQSQGPSQHRAPSQQAPLAQGSFRHQGLLQQGPPAQGHSWRGPGLASAPIATFSPSQPQSLLQMQSQVQSQTLPRSSSAQASSGLSPASASEFQSGSQPYSLCQLTTSSPGLQTPSHHPPQPYPPYWSSPSLSPACSQPALASPVMQSASQRQHPALQSQPVAVPPSPTIVNLSTAAVSQFLSQCSPPSAPQGGAHAMSTSQQAQSLSQAGLQSSSHPHLLSQPQSQTSAQAPMGTPLLVQSQIAGTGVFQDEDQGHAPLRVKSQTARTGVFRDGDQGHVQLQPQGQLLEEQPCSQQQQQQQQQTSESRSSHHGHAVLDGRKRTHDVMSSGRAGKQQYCIC